MTLKCHAKFEEKLTHGFKNDMRNLVSFHQGTQKSENFHFHGLLLSKVYNVWAKKVQRSYVLWQWRVMENLKIKLTCGLENDVGNLCKISREIDLSVQTWHEEFNKFCPKHSKISKICPLVGCLWPKYIIFSLQSTEELCLLALKIDAKFEGKLTCASKNDMRNLATFHQSTQNPQNMDFGRILWSKVENEWA